jgi:hypothetical protein
MLGTSLLCKLIYDRKLLTWHGGRRMSCSTEEDLPRRRTESVHFSTNKKNSVRGTDSLATNQPCGLIYDMKPPSLQTRRERLRPDDSQRATSLQSFEMQNKGESCVISKMKNVG